MKMDLERYTRIAGRLKPKLAEYGLQPPDHLLETVCHMASHLTQSQIAPNPKRTLLTTDELNNLTLECAKIYAQDGFQTFKSQDLERLRDGLTWLIREWGGVPPEIGVRAPINWEVARTRFQGQPA